MINHLDTLFTDFRLYNLFGDDENLTVTQLWILDIEREGSSELRFLYARSLRSSHSSDTWPWQGRMSTKKRLYEKCFVKIHTLTLYTSAKKLKTFLQEFINGASLQKASQCAKVDIPEKLVNRVGKSIFGDSPIVRSVIHLPTRDYYFLQANQLSPISDCSVDSGAISPADKQKVFSVPEECDITIAETACQVLDADTGLDFSKTDSWRIGDFEFICAPGLNIIERYKYDISFTSNLLELKLIEPLTQEPSDLLVIIKTYSEDSVQSSYITNISKSAFYPVYNQFELKADQYESISAYTMEIYKLTANEENSSLLLQTGSYFPRKIDFNLQIDKLVRGYGQFSWLEKQVPKREKAKLEKANQIRRTTLPSRTQIKDYRSDPWVPLNRLIKDRVSQLFPNKSDGRFFHTLTDSNGRSRLELVDWLKSIFGKYNGAKIAWIDPYMEDVGIELLNRLGEANADYLIITTEKKSSDDSTKKNGQPTRVDNLLTKCSEWNNGDFGSVHLKVLAVPENKLHDRMLLIRDANGQPLSGYHFSNSVQKASENHPFLVTPIPQDVIPDVFEYVDNIIQSTLYGDDGRPPLAKVIFDSSDIKPLDEENSKEVSHNYSFAEQQYAGSVIAWWLDDEQLSGFSGSELMKKMCMKGYVKDGKLDSEFFDALPSKFWKEGLPMADFHSAWDALGYVIANSPASRYYCSVYNKERSVLSEQVKLALLEHISPLRANALQPSYSNIQVDIEHYRSQKLIKLLQESNPFRIFAYESVDISYSDDFSIQILWSEDPKQFISWLSTILSKPIKQPRTHALVVKALQYICLVVSYDKNQEKIDALLQSNVSILTWIGLHALSKNINSGDLGIKALSKIEFIKPSDVRRTILCWLINEANYLNSDIKPQLIASLIQSLEAPLKDNELKEILRFVRNRNGRLRYQKPWILESMLVPMLEQKIINLTQVAHQWLTELINLWQAALKNNDYVSFTLEADGAFTDELAVLTRYLSPDIRGEIVSKFQEIFYTLARTIRIPLSSQKNLKSYNNAHEVNLWLYALANRMAELLPEQSLRLNNILVDSKKIIDRIPPSAPIIFSSDKLYIYAMDDPKDIRSHNLHQIIKNLD